MRHALVDTSPGGTYTNEQAPVVAFLNQAGDDVEVLPDGRYVLVVAGLNQTPWSLTVTKVR